MSQPNQFVIKYFDIFFQSLWRVSIRINRNKECLKIKISELFRLSNWFESFGHLDHGDRANIRTISEPEVDQVVLTSKVFLSDLFSLSVIERPITTNISFSCVTHLTLLTLFLLFLLLSILIIVCGHKSNTKGESSCEKNEVGEPTIRLELLVIIWKLILVFLWAPWRRLRWKPAY